VAEAAEATSNRLSNGANRAILTADKLLAHSHLKPWGFSTYEGGFGRLPALRVRHEAAGFAARSAKFSAPLGPPVRRRFETAPFGRSGTSPW
jgi:hypothetical protein